MTIFSLPFGQAEATKRKRDQLLRLLPWLDLGLLDLRNKEVFKHNFGRALCCGIPEFDLVIVDEAHNLKHGFGSGAVRNRVMGLMFGRDDERPGRGFPDYGPRARRVLFLSATPVEDTYRQLWNQLDVFGKATGFEALADKDASDEERRDCARRFLIRRITSLRAAGNPLTKNLYRREWRQGGVDLHDDALTVPDHKSRLVVALVQKKVSETLRSPRFNNQFQIGMLASFESFMETAGFTVGESDETPSSFDQSEQSRDEVERRGADVGVLNRLARDYRRSFGTELPHPKMDAVVDGLARSFETGEKALVFVRRVASVRELKRKLDERYDQHLLARLRTGLLKSLEPEFERLVARYRDERRRDIESAGGRSGAATRRNDAEPDVGGKDSFFAWFFRGEGPRDAFSGAALQRRFTQTSGVLSSVFDDNWVAWLLGVRPADVPQSLAVYLSRSVESVEADLEGGIRTWLGPGRAAERRNFFLGYQRAALQLMAGFDGPHRSRAQVILDHRFGEAASHVRWSGHVPAPAESLRVRTLFTELRANEVLGPLLDIDARGSGVSYGALDLGDDFVDAFRRRETKRELVSGVCRLGHPIIDLFILMANRIGTLASRERVGGEDDVKLIRAFIMYLEEQSSDPARFTSFREIRDVLDHTDLLIDLNLPAARTTPIDELPTLVGRLLREQQPIGGMAGRVNETLVRQFRMPGYPFVLVSTDLLQEGEDLHTFCSSVLHYGISWMPSSMEQRTGRIDRVNSATQRRLGRLQAEPQGTDLLQVYYPHLRDTVEVLQVDRVLGRMADFVRMMHEDLIVDRKEERQIDLATEIVRARRPPDIPSVLLTTAFPVTEEMLKGKDRALAVDTGAATALHERFAAIRTRLADPTIEWHDTAEPGTLIGVLSIGERRQPFTLFLRATAGRMLVRCVSPIGHVPQELRASLLDRGSGSPLVRIAIVGAPSNNEGGPSRRRGRAAAGTVDASQTTYDLTAEGDILLGAPEADISRIHTLIRDVAVEADALEDEVAAGADAHPAAWLGQLRDEARHER
jgi:hypothetical protein